MAYHEEEAEEAEAEEDEDDEEKEEEEYTLDDWIEIFSIIIWENSNKLPWGWTYQAVDADDPVSCGSFSKRSRQVERSIWRAHLEVIRCPIHQLGVQGVRLSNFERQQYVIATATAVSLQIELP